MKTNTRKTMPAREYYGDRPLWTPETYFRLATTSERTNIPSLFRSFTSLVKGMLKW